MPDIQKQELLQRFQPVLTAAAFDQWQKIVACMTEIEQHDKWIECHFPHEEHESLTVFPGRDKDIPASTPSALRDFLGVCNTMVYGTAGDTGQIQIHDGAGGTLHCLGGDIMNIRSDGIDYDPQICAPIDVDMAQYYFIHPEDNKIYHHDETTNLVDDYQDIVELYFNLIADEILYYCS